MYNDSYVKQYKENNLMAASPEQVLLILYDASIKFTKLAIKAIENKDRNTMHINIVKVQNILSEFMNSLDYDANAEIAENLRKTYDNLYTVLANANVNRDTKRLEFVIEQLTGLRAAWQTAINTSAKEISKIDFGSDYSMEQEFEDGVDYEL